MLINLKSNWRGLFCLFLLLSASPVMAGVDLDPVNPVYQNCQDIRTEGQNLISSKSHELNNCMSGEGERGTPIQCSNGRTTLYYWTQCSSLSCEIGDLEASYKQKYDACMDKVRQKQKEEEISKAEKRKQDAQERKEQQEKLSWAKQLNKANEVIELLSSPRKFFEKALRKNQGDFNKLFPTNDDNDMNVELANETYKFAFNASKHGLKYANKNSVITSIQQNSLKQIDKVFKQTFKQLDTAITSMDKLNNQAQQSRSTDNEKNNRRQQSKSNSHRPSYNQPRYNESPSSETTQPSYTEPEPDSGYTPCDGCGQK